MNPNPIATYTERLLEVRREFALYQDRVIVQARWWPNKRYEHVVKLATLKSEIHELMIRYRLHRYAGWVMAVGALVFAMMYYNAQGGALGVIGYIAFGVMLLGAALLGVTYPNRRIRFVRFNTKSGRAGLDIGCAGNEMAVFQQFVEQVRRQILKA
ncbi:MAG: hypothetical protein ACYC0X_06400 [Pirellulaceae bacterium]